MSQRAKVASQRAKDLKEKESVLGPTKSIKIIQIKIKSMYNIRTILDINKIPNNNLF